MEQVDSLRTGEKFKKTEIGEIPVDWEIVKIEDCCDILDSQRIPLNDEIRRDMKGQYPYYGANGLIDRINDYIFDYDLILMAEDGGHFEEYKTKPIAYLVSGKCWVNNHAHVLQAKKRWSREWVFYSVVHKNIIPYIGGGTRSKLNQKELRAIQIPAPPFTEQKKIAEILSTVDEAIEKRDKVIEKTKELKKGLMQELLTHGIGHKKFKKTKVGEIPMDWEVVRIGDICDVVGGSTPSTNKKEYWNGDILWAVPTDITKLKGNVISNTEKKITRAGLSACAAKLLPEGSILLTSRATIGACAINTKPMATNQGFASLICKANVHNWFIFYKIVSMRKELERLGSGSTFKETSKKSIRAIKIPLLPVHEQKKIAEILSTVDEEIEKETANKEKLEQTKKGLMQVLLTGKKRVESV